MKLKFKIEVRDKHTKEVYAQNSVHEFEEARALEILATGFAELVEEAEEEGQQEEIDDLEKELEGGKIVNLHDLTLKELQKLAKEEEVSTRGTKDDIIERIMAKHESEEQEND